MSRRKPHDIDTPQMPTHWRSIDDKYSDLETRLERAEAESPGGFLSPSKGLPLISSNALTRKPKPHPLGDQPRIGRRGFLASSGAAAAMLSLSGCIRRPEEKILPYVQGPEYQIPGIPLHFATVLQRGNDALGIVVTSHDGRPTKIEGNSQQSSSQGATDLRAQIQIWDLYDPDRSRGPAKRDRNEFVDKTFVEFEAEFRSIVATHSQNGGQGLRILMPPTNSPSVLRLRQAILDKFPQAKFHTWSSISDDNIREGARLAFGQALYPVYNVEHADVMLALDSDFLGDDQGSIPSSRGWGNRRAIRDPNADHMARLYSVESTYSITGGVADHRLRIPAQACEGFLRKLAEKMEGRNGFTLGTLAAAVTGSEGGAHEEFIEALADDLTGVSGKSNRRNRGRSFVVVGPRQPARVHALAHAINEALGAIGSAIRLYRPGDPQQEANVGSLKTLQQDADQVQTLLILGGNPVYDAPHDIDIEGLLSNVTSIHLGSHRDETSRLCSWHVPLAHELEAWGDQRSVDGTLSIQQPLIAPLFGGRSTVELLSMLAGEEDWRGYSVVRQTAKARISNPIAFERQWRQALHRGAIVGSTEPPITTPVQAAGIAEAIRQAPTHEPLSSSNLEVQFVPDSRLWDGRYANNLWALECPDPISKLVWDNAALMSRTTRDAHGLRNGDMIRLSRDGAGDIEIPVWGIPGHADDSITLMLGWGRTAAGRYGNAQTWPGVGTESDWRAGGFDVGPLRTADAMSFVSGVSLRKVGRSYDLVQTQTHGYMEGRPIAIDATLEEYKEEPDFASYRTVELISGPLWTEVDYSPRDVATDRPLHKWGLVIDLSACSGCNTCVVACQSENNIPAVGKQEVKRGRAMHWLRIDRYFMGVDDDPGMTMQPVACQQCEEAPCENVCPVNATSHSPEGLNDMAYNRCIGTRYCANNCPYKVRRFNYLDWHNHLDDPWQFHGDFPEIRKMQFNPNVTVRMRGVMEKCTYCVQRIQEAKFAARRDDRPLRDGEIVMACQAACPTRAIVFGDLNDPSSQVSRRDRINRRYKLLAEVGAQPRTTYLGKIRNPNPALESEVEHEAHHEEEHG